jgi:hypothetical protein
MILGAAFLLAFAGGLAGLWSLRPEYLTAAGVNDRLRRLDWGTTGMAVAAWLTVITGTWIVYPWYRAAPPEGLTPVTVEFPRYFLLANPALAGWHSFAMEWKEHVAWMAPFLVTPVAFIVWRYRDELVNRPALRQTLLVLFVGSFVVAAIAGVMGALITKAAPIH